MPLRPKTKMQAYAHKIDNNSQFMKGILIGASTGLAVVLVCVALAYGLSLPGIRPLIDGLF